MRRSASAAAPLAPEGEFAFTERDFRRVAALAYEDAGIHLTETKANLVYSRLAKRLRALRLTSFADYCALVESPEGGAERSAMISALTTNVTRFFREPHHFEHLRERVLPNLIARARAGGRVRIWSAACSSGEEVYSIAFLLLTQFPEAASHDVRLLASDIDPTCLQKAREGVYSEDAVAAIPATMRERGMEPAGRGAYRVRDAVRALVRVRPLNLIEPWPMRGRFDVIFCRNVAIYFDAQTQARLWARFAGALHPEGRLYIGHSERIDLPQFASDGLTVYRLSGGQA